VTPASFSADIPRRLSLGRLINQSTVLLMTSIGALILVLALLILFHENANATKGYSLRRLENQRTVLILEQETLNMEISEAQSLKLQDDPQIAAMAPYKNPVYVKMDPKVAYRTGAIK
jgi:hypothetical protein